MLRTNKLFRQ
jgi:hypothetical protein